MDPIILELATASCRPGAAADLVEIDRMFADVPGNAGGRLEGNWTSEIGPLNQVIQLRSYAGTGMRRSLMNTPATHDRWKEYQNATALKVVHRETKLFDLVRGIDCPAAAGNLYELRRYRTKPGEAARWVDIF